MTRIAKHGLGVGVGLVLVFGCTPHEPDKPKDEATSVSTRCISIVPDLEGARALAREATRIGPRPMMSPPQHADARWEDDSPWGLGPLLPRAWPPDCGGLFVLGTYEADASRKDLVSVLEVDFETGRVVQHRSKVFEGPKGQHGPIHPDDERAMFELLSTSRQGELTPRLADAYARWTLIDPASAAVLQVRAPAFITALVQHDRSIQPLLERALGEIELELEFPTVIEIDPPHRDLLLDRGGCAREVLDAEDAGARAYARMVELGFETGQFIGGGGTTHHLSALLPATWPPQYCEAQFYVIAVSTSPSGSPGWPTARARITVDLATGKVDSQLPASGYARGPSRIPDGISLMLQDQMFAVIGRAHAPDPTLVEHYLSGFTTNELDSIAWWHPGFGEALLGSPEPP